MKTLVVLFTPFWALSNTTLHIFDPVCVLPPPTHVDHLAIEHETREIFNMTGDHFTSSLLNSTMIATRSSSSSRPRIRGTRRSPFGCPSTCCCWPETADKCHFKSVKIITDTYTSITVLILCVQVLKVAVISPSICSTISSLLLSRHLSTPAKNKEILEPILTS